VPFVDFCFRNKKIILATAIICSVLSLLYAVQAKKKWLASQTMVLRDDLLGESFKPGRFPSQETLKNAQETLLHIAKKSEVIREALRLTHPEHAAEKDWPSDDVVDGTRDLISLVAPNGSEFGKTDVVILNVKQNSPASAKKFAQTMAEQIEHHIRIFRSDLLRSMEQELNLQYEQAKVEFEQVAEPVRKLVESTGTDLESLKAFNDTGSGGNEMQRVLENLKSEKRRALTQAQLAEKQLELLAEAKSEPEVAFARNNELMQTQPSLKRLADGLNDAKLTYNNLAGAFLSEHPRLKAAEQAVANTKQQIASEISLIESALQTQLELARDQIAFFANEEEKYESRMLSVNEKRIDFQQLTNDLTQRLEAMGKQQTMLSEIQSLANTADRVSLVAIVGEPELATNPIGLSKSWIVLMGTIGGFFLGLGIAVTLNDPKWGTAVQQKLARIEQHISSSRAKSHEPAQLPPALELADETPIIATKVTSEKPAATVVPVRPFGSGATAAKRRPAEIVREETTVPAKALPSSVDTNSSAVSPVEPTSQSNVAARVVTTIPVSQTMALAASPTVDSLSDLADKLCEADEVFGVGASAEKAKAALPNSDRIADESKTIDLNMLQNLLERPQRGAVQSATQNPSTGEPSSSPAAEQTPEERQKQLTERLSRLSDTISAYCQPLKKQDSNPGT
jgi:polysaccharide biosynthesis transport protein